MNYLKEQDLTVLIVTYGDHRKGLHASIEALEKSSTYISNVLIVQNGIDYDIKAFLKEFDVDFQFHTIINKENLGSAGGFGAGINYALTLNGSRLLILDDDNVVPFDSLNALSQTDEKFLKKQYGEKIALSLYRPLHDSDKNKFKRDYDFNGHYFMNTVYDFSFLHKLKLKSFWTKRSHEDIAELFVAPYSGLLLDKHLIESVEPVQQRYFLYGDDTRLTAKLSMTGVRILSTERYYALDNSLSWHQHDDEVQSVKNDVQQLLEMKDQTQLWRPFYSIRNGVCNSHDVFKTNNFIYYINLFIFASVPFFVYMPKNRIGLRNYSYLLRAIWDGQRGELGKVTSDYFQGQ